MKTKWMVVLATVLWIWWGAEALGGVNVTTTKTGTFTVSTPDGSKVVEQWTLTAYTPDECYVAALQLFATGPLFQVWNVEPVYDENDNFIGNEYVQTSTLQNTASLSANQRNADSHFLHSNYLMSMDIPQETNDFQYGIGTRAYGLGSDSLSYNDGLSPTQYHISMLGTMGLRQEDFSTSLHFFQLGYCPSESNTPIHVWGATASEREASPFDFWWNRSPACQWRGAGTNGRTSTSQDDTSTHWNEPTNWVDQRVPSADDVVRVDTDCGGTIFATSGEVQYLYVDGQSTNTTLKVTEGMDLTVGMNMSVGESGYGHVIQDGGRLRINGLPGLWPGLCIARNAGSTGTYELRGGQLIVDQDEYIGFDLVGVWGALPHRNGMFIQTGGTHSIREHFLKIGGINQPYGYLLEDGELEATVVLVNGSGFVQNGGKHTTDSLKLEVNTPYSLAGGILKVGQLWGGDRLGNNKDGYYLWGNLIFSGGILQADLIEFGFSNDGGVLMPGDSETKTTIKGSYIQNAGAIEIPIASLADYGRIVIQDAVSFLGGELRVSFLDGYTPNYGDMFKIMESERIDSFTMTIPEDFYAVIYDNTLSLVYIPEPGSLALLGACAAASLMRRRRRALGG